MSSSRFKTVRVLFLMFILLFVTVYSCEQKRASTSWLKTLVIVIYPINADNSEVTQRYIDSLTSHDFEQIDQFMTRQSKKYHLTLSQPAITQLGSEIKKLPPPAPQPGMNIFNTMLWSIQFRYWAWANTPDEGSNLRRARMFVLYHEGREGQSLSHSYGLNKGLLGYVNAYADKYQQEQNNIVIAHEFLHTVGATDKYDYHNQPVYPIGYAIPDKKPLYPQKHAEIMAGRIPLSNSSSRIPGSLKQCMINEITALEINWLRK